MAVVKVHLADLVRLSHRSLRQLGPRTLRFIGISDLGDVSLTHLPLRVRVTGPHVHSRSEIALAPSRRLLLDQVEILHVITNRRARQLLNILNAVVLR